MRRVLVGILGALLISHVAAAEERYADVEIGAPAGWQMSQMQTFSGSVPSRAWVYHEAATDAEVLVSVMVTEGVVDGLPKQDPANLMRLYLQSLVIGWGGQAEGDEADGEGASFVCAAGAGFRLKGRFGTRTYVYEGCLLRSEDWSRIVTVVTWRGEGSPAGEGVVDAFVSGVRLPPPED